jgi:hypothetical protein
MYCTALLYCTALHTPLYFSASLLYCQCSLTHSIIPFSPSPLLHTYPHTVRAAAAASRERPCHVFAPAGVGTTGIDCSVLLLYFTLLYLAYALPIHHLYLTYTLPMLHQYRHHKFWRDRSFSSVSQGARRGGASQA